MLCYCNAVRGAASKNLGVVKEPAMNWVVFMALWIWPARRKALTCWISDEWASSVTLVKRLCKSEGFRVNYQQSGWGIQPYQLCKTYGLGCKQPPPSVRMVQNLCSECLRWEARSYFEVTFGWIRCFPARRVTRRSRAGSSGSSISMGGQKSGFLPKEKGWSTWSQLSKSSSSRRATIPLLCTAGKSRLFLPASSFFSSRGAFTAVDSILQK